MPPHMPIPPPPLPFHLGGMPVPRPIRVRPMRNRNIEPYHVSDPDEDDFASGGADAGPTDEQGDAPAREPITASEVGRNLALLSLDHRYDKDGNLRIVPSELSSSDADEAKAAVLAHALVLRRMYNKDHELITKRLDINSPLILKALEEIVEYWPAEPRKISGDALKVNAPYDMLYHHWDKLQEYYDRIVAADDDEEDNKDMQSHLCALADFMDREIGEDRAQAQSLVEGEHITFRLLWTLFKPGELVFRKGEGVAEWRLYRLRSFSYDKDECGNRYFSLHVSRTNYDGKTFGREEKSLQIDEDEVRQGQYIPKLSVIPLRFAEEWEEKLEAITKRGERFLELKDIHVQRYVGTVQALQKPPLDFYSHLSSHYAGTWQKTLVNGRIIVHTKAFCEENPSHKPHVSTEVPHKSAPRHTVDFWDACDPSVAPATVFGYHPSLKQWCSFSISHISDPAWDPNAFDNLILPDAPKRVIRSLVTSHEYPTDTAVRDKYELKGKGICVLLGGAAGTGKTMCAESVAEHTKRPLLRVSAGELGSTVFTIESKLSSFLQYAALWKAIVLIDEADVFVEARQSGISNRLEQNALVAIFLSRLEYFGGIIFLTSNRAEGFDPAIKSRMHMILRFEPPSQDLRKQLWEQMLGRIPEGERGYELDQVWEIVKEAEMNGREISNAVHILRTLARESGGKVTRKEFETLMDVWGCFGAQDGKQRFLG